MQRPADFINGSVECYLHLSFGYSLNIKNITTRFQKNNITKKLFFLDQIGGKS